MPAPIVRGESLVEYFKGQVDAALDHQHVHAGELTAYYLVQLLASFARADAQPSSGAPSDEPLVLSLARALEAGGSRQCQLLRAVGDQSLFVSGFFSDSLARGLVDVDYYASLGGYAYASLSQQPDVLTPAFGELADRFVAFADVLAEVSEHCALTSNSDLLRLYEKWARGGSLRAADLLARRGIVPVADAGRRIVQ